MKTAYITTPIYYPSGSPHIGSAYTSTACDVYARFKRLDGFDMMFLTGTDEHGLKIQRKAEDANLSPQEYLDGIIDEFKGLSDTMNLSNDDFIRTTEERHKKVATKIWQKMEANGFIYKDTYAGWYSVPDETFYTEDELVDGKSPDSGHPVEWVEEESYFFKLSEFGDKLMAYYEANPQFIMPKSRRNEVMSFVKSGLRDLSISRSTFSHGIDVPGDDKHIMYVWIDALTNYLSALSYPDGEKMNYWGSDKTVHVVGKDILRFHAVYWPAFLMAADIELPKMIYAHGWWTSEGKKMSKSFGNVVDPVDAVNEFGQDQLRFYMLREVPFGNDGDFSKERMVERINSDLANALGNLFQRVLSMVNKNCEAKVPAYGELSTEDKAFIDAVQSLPSEVRTEMETLQFHKALEKIWVVIGKANQYMDSTQPWKLKKENPEQMAHVLRVLMESFRTISLMVEAFMPTSAANMKTQIGIESADLSSLTQEFFGLETGTELPKPEGIFMRIQTTEAA